MNIVHQLRSGGDADFDDVYCEVPWIELVTDKSARHEDRVRRFDSMPGDRRRAFKTHSAVGPLPYFSADKSPDVRYIVVLRNPDEVLASFYPFMKSMSPGWYDYWDMDDELGAIPDFATYYDKLAKMLILPGVFGFVAAWWPLRNEPNVMLAHFSDLKRDHEGSVRRVADFLGFTPTAQQMTKVLEYTSFRWMKEHEDKFEARLASAVPMVMPGAFIRKGAVGTAREDGVTPAMSEELRRIGAGYLTDSEALHWLYEGGSISGSMLR
jgi:hypothetical protein